MVLIPSTENSVLRERLQRADDQVVKLLNTPLVEFIERGGTMIEEDLGRTTPWSLD